MSERVAGRVGGSVGDSAVCRVSDSVSEQAVSASVS